MTRTFFDIDRNGVGFPLARVVGVWLDGLEVVVFTTRGEHRFGPYLTVADAAHKQHDLLVRCGK